jgi:hypothetical protein
MIPHLNIQTMIFFDVAAPSNVCGEISEGVERMGIQGRTEKGHSRLRQALLRVLGEIVETAPHSTPTRAATAASAARVLVRLLACDTRRQAS